MDFPLYSTLSLKLPKKDLTISQKSDLTTKLNNIDTEGAELIFALINCYYIDKDKGDSMTIPYNGKLSPDKVDFDLSDLPIPLRHILYKFVSLHKKKIQEDKMLSEQKGI
jgi:hypothetical protein